MTHHASEQGMYWPDQDASTSFVSLGTYIPLDVIHRSLFEPRRHLLNCGIGINVTTDDMFRVQWNQLDVDCGFRLVARGL